MGLIGNISIGMSVNTAPLKQGLSEAQGRLASFGARVSSSLVSPLSGFAGLALGVTTAFGGFLAKGIAGAMDLGETMSKTQEVFKDSTAEVVANANKMAASFGLPKKALLDASSSFGLLANGANITGKEAAKLSVRLSNLAADAASFYNTDLSTALEKIRAGLSGESEPLKAFGVLMDEASVKAEQLRMGLNQSTRELQDRAKILARVSVIEKGLAKATGDLERTSSSAANQFRKTTGGLENFSVSIGELFLPAVTSGVNALNDFGASVIQAFDNSRSSIEGFAGMLDVAIGGLSFYVRNLSNVWKSAELRATEFIANLMEHMRGALTDIVSVAGWFRENFTAIFADAFNAVVAGFGNLKTNILRFADAIQNYFDNPGKGFKVEFVPMLEGFKSTVSKLPEMFKPVAVSLQKEIDALNFDITGVEFKRLQDMAKIASLKAKPDAAEAKKPWIIQQMPKKPKLKYDFAGIADLGSSEAQAAILRHRNGGDKAMEEGIQVARRQLTTQERIARALERKKAKRKAARQTLAIIGLQA